MALKTDYKDDVLDTSANTQRKYNMISNDDGTVSFEDVTVYLQEGDSFGAQEINQINEGLEELKKSVSDGKAMVASAITEKLEVETATDASFETLANNILNSNSSNGITISLNGSGGHVKGAYARNTLDLKNINTLNVNITQWSRSDCALTITDNSGTTLLNANSISNQAIDVSNISTIIITIGYTGSSGSYELLYNADLTLS